MSIKFTRQKYLEAWQADRHISRHVSIVEATESISEDAEINGPGEYQIRVGSEVWYQVVVGSAVKPTAPEIIVPPPEIITPSSSSWEIESDFPGPPNLISPRKYVGAASLTVVMRRAFSNAGPGKVHTMPPNPGGDIFIDLRTDAAPLPYPLHIPDCRSVILLAPWIVLESQPGNEKFALPNHPLKDWPLGKMSGNAAFDAARAPHYGWNIHERIALSGLIKAQATDVTYIEGALLDAGGRQGDVIIIQRSSNKDPAYSLLHRKFIATNCRLLDYEGQAAHPDYGDGWHGDAFQVQTNVTGNLREVWLQNWYQRSLQQGLVDTASPDGPNRKFSFVRFQHVQSEEFKTNEINLTGYANPGERAGAPPIVIKMSMDDDWRIKDCWYGGQRNRLLTLRKHSPTMHIVAIGDGPSARRIEHAEAHKGIRPQDPAPANKLGGVNYTSPFVYSY